jgi:hypothetical protein
MENKEKKRIMSDLAAGRIAKEEADRLMIGEKKPQIKPNKQIKGKKSHTRKRSIKSKEAK